MIALALLLAGAAVGFGVARWLRLPLIPFLLLAGFLIGLTGRLPEPLLEDAVVLGLTFLVFVAGSELNLKRVAGQKTAALRVGLAQFFLLAVAVFGAARLLGYALEPALYLALALAASSTLVVVRILQTRRQMFEPFGRLVLGVLLLQDLLVILLIPVLGGIPDGIDAILPGLAGALVLVGVAYVGLRWVTPFIVLRMRLEDEELLLAVLTVLFAFLGLAHWLGLPLVAGGFLAGFSLSGFPVAGIVREHLSPVSDFFLAIFFTALGGLLVLPSATELAHAVGLALVVIVVTPPLVAAVAEGAGLSARPAIEGGLLLAQASEFSLLVGLQGLALGQLGANLFTVIALVTVLTMVLTPFISTDEASRWFMRFHPLRARFRLEAPPAGHILLLGCGANGFPLLETLVTMGQPVVVVDDDPVIISRLEEAEIPWIRGDGSDPFVLDRANARGARLIISTMRRAEDHERMLAQVRGVPVLVRVFDPDEAERIRAVGGTPILYSEAAAEDFVEWFESELEAAAARASA